ncbi:putative NUDIX family NTP pyrophosphohydrolase [Amorphus sp. MBR-141]
MEGASQVSTSQTYKAYSDLPLFSDFASVADTERYVPLPDDWFVALTDVVKSTQAIRDGHYKAVNMAGAAAIAAVINALDGDASFPFIFGGDGTALALPETSRETTEAALAATARWVEEDLELTLRTATVSVAEIRRAGHDVRVARFAASDAMTYALFSGGGVSWAEREMKAGRFPAHLAPPGTRPDLEGLSCRWKALEPQRGTILTILAVPPSDDDNDPAFREVVHRLIDVIEASDRGGRPLADDGPSFAWPPEGLELEARATRGTRSLAMQKLKISAVSLLAWVLDRTRQTLGQFDPVVYRKYTALNADFRKYQDGIRMTVDCAPATVERIEAILKAAREARTLDYGLLRQQSAVMTCFVPSVTTNTHFHFIDGAQGGYAAAAASLKGDG